MKAAALSRDGRYSSGGRRGFSDKFLFIVTSSRVIQHC